MYTLINIKKALIALSVSAMLLTSSFTASATFIYYKSVGVNGEVRYTQFPPENTDDYETITMRNDGRREDMGTMAGRTSADRALRRQLSPAEQQAEAVQERVKKQKLDDRVRRCQVLRNNLTNLNIGDKVYKKKNGKKYYLNKSQMEKERKIIQQAIKQYCERQSI